MKSMNWMSSEQRRKLVSSVAWAVLISILAVIFRNIGLPGLSPDEYRPLSPAESSMLFILCFLVNAFGGYLTNGFLVSCGWLMAGTATTAARLSPFSWVNGMLWAVTFALFAAESILCFKWLFKIRNQNIQRRS